MTDPPGTDRAIVEAIRARAAAMGFERVGFCDAAETPAEERHFERWLASGMHATMAWMEKSRARRLRPRLVLEGTRSMIVVAMPYARPGAGPAAPAAAPATDAGGSVARYARGADYHKVMGARLLELERFIEASAPGHRAISYVDTGPVLERMWAARAGIGWVGKNALILNKDMGSWFFLGVVLTTLRLPADAPALDQCGSCTSCLDACPTGAIVEPRMVDSNRCIAYHTIELRSALPEAHRDAIGERLFGCDDCQEACPWNRETAAGPAPAAPTPFPPRPESARPELLDILFMTHPQYLERFRDSAIRRATWRGLRRNAAAALGNVGDGDETLGALERVGGDPDEDPIVREQANWSARKVRARLGKS